MLVTGKSLGEDWPMCPKHGIAHGVCVDPIKANDIKGLTTMFEGASKAFGMMDSQRSTDKVADRITVVESPPDSNRFDPYEALDDIEQWLDGITSAHADGIRAYLRALRAYITGMER